MHLGCAKPHRAANLQPTGGETRSGGRPLIASSRVWLGCASLGIDFRSASVYGWRVSAKSERVDAYSTIWPAYITAVLSARPATTPRSVSYTHLRAHETP